MVVKMLHLAKTLPSSTERGVSVVREDLGVVLVHIDTHHYLQHLSIIASFGVAIAAHVPCICPLQVGQYLTVDQFS